MNRINYLTLGCGLISTSIGLIGLVVFDSPVFYTVNMITGVVILALTAYIVKTHKRLAAANMVRERKAIATVYQGRKVGTPESGATTYHDDGTVTFLDNYTGHWFRSGNPNSLVIMGSGLSDDEQAQIVQHIRESIQ